MVVALRPPRRRAKRQGTEIFRGSTASFHFVAPARGKGGRLLVAARQAPPTHRGGFGRAATIPSPSEALGDGNLSRDGRALSFVAPAQGKGGRLLVAARQAPPTHRGGFGRAATIPSPSEALGDGNLSRDGRVFHSLRPHREKAGACLSQRDKLHQLTVVALVALRPPRRRAKRQTTEIFRGSDAPFHSLRPHRERGACLSQRDRFKPARSFSPEHPATADVRSCTGPKSAHFRLRPGTCRGRASRFLQSFPDNPRQRPGR